VDDRSKLTVSRAVQVKSFVGVVLGFLGVIYANAMVAAERQRGDFHRIPHSGAARNRRA